MLQNIAAFNAQLSCELYDLDLIRYGLYERELGTVDTLAGDAAHQGLCQKYTSLVESIMC